MQILQLILLFTAFCFSGQRYTVRADGTGDYLTPQQCEDFLTKNYSGVGIDTCDVTQAGRYVGALVITGQTNTDATNYPMFMSSLGYSKVEIYNSTTHTVDINNSPFARVCCLTIAQGNSSQYVVRYNSAVEGVIVDKCYIKAIVDAYGVTYSALPGGTPRAILQNSVVRCSTGSSTKSGVYAPIALNNVTVIGFKQGITEALPTNVAVVTEKSSPQPAFSALIAGGNYNSSYDGTAPGANSLLSITDIKLKSDSVHILKTSPLFGVGTTISGSFRDIDSELWRTMRSIGGDEPYDSSDSTTSRKCGRLWRAGMAPCKGP